MTDRSESAASSVQYLNPDSLAKSNAFTQAVAVTGPAKTIYLGAQTAVDSAGAIVGKGDVAAQTQQILDNIDACLVAGGASRQHLIQWNIFIVQGQPIMPAFAVFQGWWGNRANPPANTVMFVSGFLDPDLLLTIDAIAVVPQP